MGVASGCGYQEVGVASGSGWNLWVWLVGGMYGCGYQEVGVVGRRRVWLAGGIYAGVLNWRYDAIHGARECQRASIFFLAPL